MQPIFTVTPRNCPRHNFGIVVHPESNFSSHPSCNLSEAVIPRPRTEPVVSAKRPRRANQSNAVKPEGQSSLKRFTNVKMVTSTVTGSLDRRPRLVNPLVLAMRSRLGNRPSNVVTDQTTTMRSAANAIVLLGPPRDLEISSASGALPRPALALLAYLLLDCSGGRVSREEAGAFLWEDVDRPRQAGNLRQLLFRIRAAEAAADMRLLEATATQIALRPRNVSIDLRRFQAAIRLTNGANVAAACEAYSGELLAGLTAYSDGLASWLARERARLRADFLTALKPYVAARANGPVDEAAIVAATRILELDPRQEIAYQALIQAYLERGDATLANQYRHQREQADEIRGERRPRAAIVAPVEPDLAGAQSPTGRGNGR